MKSILAVLALTLAIYAVNAQGPTYKTVNNACTKLKTISIVLSEFVGIYKVVKINQDLKCTKFYFNEDGGKYTGNYDPVTPQFQDTYGVKGQYLQDPNNGGLLERFINNSTDPLSVKAIIAYEVGKYFACAACEAKDDAGISFVAIQVIGEISADKLDELTKKVEAETGVTLKTVIQNC